MFCFLPLPDSIEVNPPLPVSVHGTFGLNKDRHHLKWMTSDMKNDDGALWNEILLSKLLPSCYAECLDLLKEKFTPDAFYSNWPSASVISNTNWKIILFPLFLLLLQGQYFWSENGKWVGLDSSACVVPQVYSGQFPKVVIDVLIRCGKTAVVLPDIVWEAVKFIYEDSLPFTTIIPSVVRQAVKSVRQSYTNLSKKEKKKLLHFCLEDKRYPDLIGLILLPTLGLDTAFIPFTSSHCQEKVYVCRKKFIETNILSNNSSKLVCMEGEDEELHALLMQIAQNGCTQLQVLTIEAIAFLLKNNKVFENGWCFYATAENFYNNNWLKKFWVWVREYNLEHFSNVPLIPVCERNENGFKVEVMILQY